MISPDSINGLYEVLGAFVIWTSVVQLRKDKVVKGYNPIVTWFFATWGLWNLYYYHHLDQPISWYGGMALFVVNCIWLAHLYYYLWQRPKGYHTKISEIDKLHLSYQSTETNCSVKSLQLQIISTNKEPVWIVNLSNNFQDFSKIETISVSSINDKHERQSLLYEVFDESILVVFWNSNEYTEETRFLFIDVSGIE